MDAEIRLPRKIWFMWWQGFDEAPEVVRQCWESWRQNNPGWRITFIDKANVKQYVSVDLEDNHFNRLGLARMSDVIRLELLKRYGGVWADATCFCCQPLDDWIDSAARTGFFAFSWPGPDRMVASWFLAAVPDNALVATVSRDFLEYLRNVELNGKTNKKVVKMGKRVLNQRVWTTRFWFSWIVMKWFKVYPYFALHYKFSQAIRQNRECRAIWNHMPKVSADGPHYLKRSGLSGPASDAVRQHVEQRQSPVYKLTWKCDTDCSDRTSTIGYLFWRRLS